MPNPPVAPNSSIGDWSDIRIAYVSLSLPFIVSEGADIIFELNADANNAVNRIVFILIVCY